MMKQFLSLFLSVLLILSFTGCSQETEPEPNPITEKLYNLNNQSDAFDFDLLWFNTDGTVQALKVVGIREYASSYGTYEVKDNTVTLNYGSESYAGVIREDGNRVYFDDAEFLDWTDYTKPNDPIYDEITK